MEKPISDNPLGFRYPEFEGEEGYLLLHKIMNAILPLALARTWHAFMSVMKYDKMPYASVADISEFTGLSERKIQKDLEAFRSLDLLVLIPDLRIIDGEVRRVDYKNFRGLYDLAHEYHLWTLTDDYQLYQPTYDDAPRIRENRVLYKKLIRFENYRRRLMTKRPGRQGEQRN